MIPSDTCVLIADHGIGDHFLVASLAEAVRGRYRLRVWMAGRADCSFVTDLFPAVERYLTIPAGVAPGTVQSASQISGGACFYSHFPQLELMRAVGYNGFQLLDAYLCRLGLPFGTPLTPARLPSTEDVARAETLLNSLGFPPGRTVVISLDSRSTTMEGVDGAFWIALATELAAAGLTPLVNLGPKTIVPEGLRSLAVPIAGFRELVEAAGAVITIRNGLSDLSSNLRAQRVVVFPDARYWSGPLIAGTAFDRYGLVHPPHSVLHRCGEAAVQAREITALLAQAEALVER